MKIDLFPTTVRKYNIPNNDDFISYWNKEYDDCKFKEMSPLVMAYNQLAHEELNVSYHDILDQFMIDIGANETHSYCLQTIIFKCLKKF